MTRGEYGFKAFILIVLIVAMYLTMVVFGFLSYEETRTMFFSISMLVIILIFIVQWILEKKGFIQVK